MKRDKAISAYRRVQAWSGIASQRLTAEMRAQGAEEPVALTLHNWGRMAGREPYRTLDRRMRGRQRRIWDASKRLGDFFARSF